MCRDFPQFTRCHAIQACLSCCHSYTLCNLFHFVARRNEPCELLSGRCFSVPVLSVRISPCLGVLGHPAYLPVTMMIPSLLLSFCCTSHNTLLICFLGPRSLAIGTSLFSDCFFRIPAHPSTIMMTPCRLAIFLLHIVHYLVDLLLESCALVFFMQIGGLTCGRSTLWPSFPHG